MASADNVSRVRTPSPAKSTPAGVDARTPLRAAIYCRISRDPSGLELGVQRQERDCRDLCEREDWSVAAVFVDDDRSAYTGKPRPGFVALRDLLKGPGVDVVVAWHPDRLTRHPRELEDLIDLLEATSTTVRCCRAGEYDLTTPTGRTYARVIGAFARGESEHKSDRLRRKHLELAEDGKVSGGGSRPFGYETDRVTVRPGEAALIRELAARVLAGESTRSLAAELTARGVPTSTGAKWVPMTVTRILRSPRIAGLRVHRGEITAQVVWPAIITPDEHRRLAAVFSDPTRKKNHGKPRRLLTGILKCGRCGESLVSRPRGDKTPSYVCAKGPGFKGCGGTRILGAPLEEMVVTAVLERVASPAFAEAVNTSPDDDSGDLAALEQIDVQLSDLGAMWASGELDRASWAGARDALMRRRADVDARIAARPAQRAAAALFDQSLAWHDTDGRLTVTDRHRAALAAVIDRIVVGPAVKGRNYFDRSRVSIVWRG